MPSSPLKRIRNQNPSGLAILVACLVLFILFLWLNFALAQEIELRGREIQEKSEELGALEREGGALLAEISVASSERRLAEEAEALGYKPQSPVYVLVSQPIVRDAPDALGGAWRLADTVNGAGQSAAPSEPVWNVVARQDQWLASEALP